MNIIYLALLCGLIATSFVYKSEARFHVESMVGGTAAAVGQNTYAVSIQINNQHHCSGGILNSRYIITVAHCFIDPVTNRFENEEYIVAAGVIKAHNEQEPYREKREVAKIYIPRIYNAIIRNIKIADIAVLELKSGLGLNQFITNVILPLNARTYPTYEGQQAVVCSYGHNWVRMRHDPHSNKEVEDCSGSYCYERRFAEVNIISNMACLDSYTDIVDSHLCGHMRQRSHATPEGLCGGDSGAPLVIHNTIIGVASTSPLGCREDEDPAIYTRVTSFIPLITNIMNGGRASNMRLAKYVVNTKACRGASCKKVLVEVI